MNACCNCGKRTSKMINLLKGENIITTSFCCYSCYLDFWRGVAGFVPLKQAKQAPIPKPVRKPLRIIFNKWWCK